MLLKKIGIIFLEFDDYCFQEKRMLLSAAILLLF